MYFLILSANEFRVTTGEVFRNLASAKDASVTLLQDHKLIWNSELSREVPVDKVISCQSVIETVLHVEFNEAEELLPA